MKAHNNDEEVKNPKIIAKIFNPYGKGHWYLIDMDDNDIAFGLCCLDFAEIGYVSFKELDEILVHGLPLERDLHWSGNLEDAQKEADGRGYQ